ncbi:hypothetical protein ACOMHN_037227 [Nucella lapillus]
MWDVGVESHNVYDNEERVSGVSLFLLSVGNVWCPGHRKRGSSLNGSIFNKKLDDPTQLILMLEVTDLVGIVSLLYGMLLHSGMPSHRDMAPCELSVQTLAITVVLQHLYSLPFQYFSDPHLTGVLFPTLISCCYNNHSNRRIFEQELSCVLLANFSKNAPTHKTRLPHITHRTSPPTNHACPTSPTERLHPQTTLPHITHRTPPPTNHACPTSPTQNAPTHKPRLPHITHRTSPPTNHACPTEPLHPQTTLAPHHPQNLFTHKPPCPTSPTEPLHPQTTLAPHHPQNIFTHKPRLPHITHRTSPPKNHLAPHHPQNVFTHKPPCPTSPTEPLHPQTTLAPHHP